MHCGSWQCKRKEERFLPEEGKERANANSLLGHPEPGGVSTEAGMAGAEGGRGQSRNGGERQEEEPGAQGPGLSRRTLSLALGEMGATGGSECRVPFILAQSLWLPGQESLTKDKGRRQQGGGCNHPSEGHWPRGCVKRWETQDCLQRQSQQACGRVGYGDTERIRRCPRGFWPKTEVGMN